MNTETVRTVTPDIYLRNLRNRAAVLTLHSINRLLTADETKELKELREKIAEMERQA